MRKQWYWFVCGVFFLNLLMAQPLKTAQGREAAPPDTAEKMAAKGSDDSIRAVLQDAQSAKHTAAPVNNGRAAEGNNHSNTGNVPSGWLNWRMYTAVAAILTVISTIIIYLQGVKRAAKLEKKKLEQKFDEKIQQLELQHQQKLENLKLELQSKHEQEMAPFRLQQETDKEMARKRAEDAYQQEQQQTASESLESIYGSLLRRELGYISLRGHPELDAAPVNLDDAFVSLRISREWRCGEQLAEDPQDNKAAAARVEALSGSERDLEPAELLKTAFRGENRLLLIIGEPGSGKTTLMKYYALSVLSSEKRPELGLNKKTLPLFFPLREFTLDDQGAGEVIGNLARWGNQHNTRLNPEVLEAWLQRKPTLVLLDGLDEVNDLKARKQICRCIEQLINGYAKARVVVTCRWAGYGKAVDVAFQQPHVRADVRDFSFAQQQRFLENWYYARFKQEQADGRPLKEKEQNDLRQKAREKAAPLAAYLGRKENHNIRKLVEVPLLLQILTLIWEQRRYRPDNRSGLYRAAMSYLLVDRDREREIIPPFADESLSVLKPLALWMQEDLKQDYAETDQLLEKCREYLAELKDAPPSPEAFFNYLYQRTGLFHRYSETAWIFRHRSFMEYLAAQQLKDIWHNKGCMERLAGYLFDTWWEETLRFFMSEATPEMFRRFMQAFLAHPKSRDLSETEKQRLLQLVKDTPQSNARGLADRLKRTKSQPRIRLIIDCLKTINSRAAYQALKAFAEDPKRDAENRDYAAAAIQESAFAKEIAVSEPAVSSREKGPEKAFRHPLEYNARYILIPGGRYHYSVTETDETVPALYVAEYPLTNRRYRRFIRYLAGEEAELQGVFDREAYVEQLFGFAETVEGFSDYLEKDIKRLAGQLRSEKADNKRFNGDDQPVVGVDWYAARAYCLWLSLLTLAKENGNPADAVTLFRLPTEIEWEWAAAGREPGGKLRKYPWPPEKGEPNEKLANYDSNVGATTPVGSYPQGATPEGLMDMAGNVWEWMDNRYNEKEEPRLLRGGGWRNVNVNLSCSARLNNNPGVRNLAIGLRVLCVRSLSIF